MRKWWIVCLAALLALPGAEAMASEEASLSGVREMLLEGLMGQRFDANLEQWMYTAPYVNPAMFEMYRQRDVQPEQQLMAWYGEFTGKYLTSAVYLYRMRQDPELEKVIRYTVDMLAEVQGEDGYLGVFPKERRLIGSIHPDMQPRNWPHWDSWNHYHNMLGLLLWHQATGDEKALAVCRRAADYVYGFFIGGGRTLDECGSGETNMAIGHVYALLYQQTKDERYLEMTMAALKAFETDAGGDYYRAALKGVPFYKMDKPRWESLHCVQMLCELYKITGEESYRKAFENIWWSIVVYDRHNTGGFSSGEQAQGNPYDLRAIETCCTVAWTALSVDMLKLTGDSYVADELELTAWNGMIGSQHPSGRSFTYNSPMIGDKKASSHDIVFQAHAGSYELNCCSVNGPRGIGMIGDWGALADDGRVTLNYYGPSRIRVTLPDGRSLTLVQETDYPVGDTIRIRVECDAPVTAKLRLRIPFWSEHSRMSLNGNPLPDPTPRSYYGIDNTWRDGDEIVFTPDLSLHYWHGNFEVGGKASVYRGPLLLTYDQRFNPQSYLDAPTLDQTAMDYELLPCADPLWPPPWLLAQFTDTQGRPVVLCDYASAGATGAGFTTWLPMQNGAKPMEYQSKTPMWGAR